MDYKIIDKNVHTYTADGMKVESVSVHFKSSNGFEGLIDIQKETLEPAEGSSEDSVYYYECGGYHLLPSMYAHEDISIDYLIKDRIAAMLGDESWVYRLIWERS